MKPTTIAKGSSFILSISLCPAQSEAVTTIVGDSIDIWGVAQLNAVETYRDTIIVTDPGVDCTAAIIDDIYSLDFGPTSVVLTTINPWYSPWFNSGNPPSALELRGINVSGEPNLIIGSIDVRITGNIVPEENAPANYPDFSAINVTFAACLPPLLRRQRKR